MTLTYFITGASNALGGFRERTIVRLEDERVMRHPGDALMTTTTPERLRRPTPVRRSNVHPQAESSSRRSCDEATRPSPLRGRSRASSNWKSSVRAASSGMAPRHRTSSKHKQRVGVSSGQRHWRVVGHGPTGLLLFVLVYRSYSHPCVNPTPSPIPRPPLTSTPAPTPAPTSRLTLETLLMSAFR